MLLILGIMAIKLRNLKLSDPQIVFGYTINRSLSRGVSSIIFGVARGVFGVSRGVSYKLLIILILGVSVIHGVGIKSFTRGFKSRGPSPVPPSDPEGPGGPGDPGDPGDSGKKKKLGEGYTSGDKKKKRKNQNESEKEKEENSETGTKTGTEAGSETGTKTGTEAGTGTGDVPLNSHSESSPSSDSILSDLFPSSRFISPIVPSRLPTRSRHLLEQQTVPDVQPAQPVQPEPEAANPENLVPALPDPDPHPLDFLMGDPGDMMPIDFENLVNWLPNGMGILIKIYFYRGHIAIIILWFCLHTGRSVRRDRFIFSPLNILFVPGAIIPLELRARCGGTVLTLADILPQLVIFFGLLTVHLPHGLVLNLGHNGFNGFQLAPIGLTLEIQPILAQLLAGNVVTINPLFMPLAVAISPTPTDWCSDFSFFWQFAQFTQPIENVFQFQIQLVFFVGTDGRLHIGLTIQFLAVGVSYNNCGAYHVPLEELASIPNLVTFLPGFSFEDLNTCGNMGLDLIWGCQNLVAPPGCTEITSLEEADTVTQQLALLPFGHTIVIVHSPDTPVNINVVLHYLRQGLRVLIVLRQ